MKAGWEVKPLGEVCEFKRGLTYQKGDEVEAGGTPVLRANNVDLAKGELDLNEIRYIDATIEVPNAKKVVPGSLLICTASGSKKHLGKTALIETDMDFAFGGFMGLLIPRSIILPSFLQWLLRSDAYWSFIDGLSDGANINNLKFSQLSDFPIPLPPLEEQRRIVALLDEAFEGLNRARENTETNLTNARELFESVLKNAFLETPENWVRAKLKDICSKIGSGATPRGGAASYKLEGTSLIRSLNVHDRSFKYEKLAFIDDEQSARLDNVTIEANDVLFNITGASVARCCVVPDNVLPARVNQHVSILRPDESKLLPNFLCLMLTSEGMKEALLKTGAEGGATRQAITKSQLEDLEVVFPSAVNEQTKIIGRLAEIEAGSLRIRDEAESKLADLEDLRQSLLQKAFAGELT